MMKKIDGLKKLFAAGLTSCGAVNGAYLGYSLAFSRLPVYAKAAHVLGWSKISVFSAPVIAAGAAGAVVTGGGIWAYGQLKGRQSVARYAAECEGFTDGPKSLPSAGLEIG